MASPDYTHATLRLDIEYRPAQGTVTISDQWRMASGDSSFSLVSTHNVLREGRENAYRSIRETIGQYLDIIEARHAENP